MVKGEKVNKIINARREQTNIIKYVKRKEKKNTYTLNKYVCINA